MGALKLKVKRLCTVFPSNRDPSQHRSEWAVTRHNDYYIFYCNSFCRSADGGVLTHRTGTVYPWSMHPGFCFFVFVVVVSCLFFVLCFLLVLFYFGVIHASYLISFYNHQWYVTALSFLRSDPESTVIPKSIRSFEDDVDYVVSLSQFIIPEAPCGTLKIFQFVTNSHFLVKSDNPL